MAHRQVRLRQPTRPAWPPRMYRRRRTAQIRPVLVLVLVVALRVPLVWPAAVVQAEVAAQVEADVVVVAALVPVLRVARPARLPAAQAVHLARAAVAPALVVDVVPRSRRGAVAAS